MVLSLAWAGLAVFLVDLGAGQRRAQRFADSRLRPRRSVRKVCAGCERQRALFRTYGVVKWDRYHTLCGRCFRGLAEALKTTALQHIPEEAIFTRADTSS